MKLVGLYGILYIYIKMFAKIQNY